MKHIRNSLALSSFMLALAGNAEADQTWTGTGPDRNWNNPANWFGSPTGTPNAVPSSTEKANIWNNPGPVIDAPTPTVLRLDIGRSTGSALDIGAGGTLTVNDWFIIGYGASLTGTFNVNGGTTSVPVSGKDIQIGFNGTGNVVMADGSITIADDLLFGTGATGVGDMSMSNGTVSVTDDVSIGNVAGGKGYLTMSGGMLTDFDDLFIGDTGTGEVTMTGTVGATITCKAGTGHDLIVGRNAGSNGKLSMSNGAITINGIAYVGLNGTGLLDMTGGTITAASVLVIGRNTGSSGEVLLKGGEITAANLEFTNGVQIALLSHLDITGGKLILSGDQVGRVNGFIDSGNLTTAYGDRDLLHVDYDSDTNLTTVTAQPGITFPAWIAGTFAHGTLPQDQQDPEDDHDNDGIPNLLEYAIADQDPTVPNPSIGSFDGTTLRFTKRTGTIVTHAIQQSTDLGVIVPWTDVPVGPSYTNNATTISYTLTPSGSPKNFFRLRVFSN